VRFQRSLYLCSSHEKSSCSGRLVDSAASCSYCTEGIAFQASARATTRGDEAGACVSGSDDSLCPQTCPSYFTDQCTCSYLHVGVSRRPAAPHLGGGEGSAIREQRELRALQVESQRFTGAGLPIQQATPSTQDEALRIHCGPCAGHKGAAPCHTGDSQWCAPVTYVPATDSPPVRYVS
jgi:hypothetical protein